MTALIQRSSIMARVGVWDLATADLAAAAQQAKPAAAVSLNSQELNALRRVFERWAALDFRQYRARTSVLRRRRRI